MHIEISIRPTAATYGLGSAPAPCRSVDRFPFPDAHQMKIGIVTPAPPESRSGNRVTANRWAKILRKLGHRVVVSQSYNGESFDMLVALHARRSSGSIKLFRRLQAGAPLIVALTGTDLYRDLSRSKEAQTSLALATRIVVLQSQALLELRPALRKKARVVYQSVSRSNRPRPRLYAKNFDVCVWWVTFDRLRTRSEPQWRPGFYPTHLEFESRTLELR